MDKNPISIVLVVAMRMEAVICVMIAVRVQKGDEVLEGAIFIVINCAFGLVDLPEEDLEEILLEAEII